MKKFLLILLGVAVIATVAFADENGLGVFGSYWNADDPGNSFGGGIKFKAELGDFFGLDVRASCLTQFKDWDGDDELFVIPLEALLLFRIPLGETSPVKAYVGGGGGYAIIPKADDVDFDDDFCLIGVGGVEFALNESLSLFAEAMYRYLEVDGAKVDGVKVKDLDISFSGLGVNAGLLFRF